MLKRLIEAQSGQLTTAELRAVLDLATTDIRVNRIGTKQRTSLRAVVEIAGMRLMTERRCSPK